MGRAGLGFAGAVLGGLFGGPVGAVAGAALGAWLGGGEPELLPAELDYAEHPDGLLLRLRAQVPARHVLFSVLRADGERRRGREPFLDEEGHNLLVADWEGGWTMAFLPHGMTRGAASGDQLLAVYVDAAGRVIGQSLFEGLPRPAVARWDAIELFRPLLLLAMRVARAEGDLQPQAVRLVRERFAPSTPLARERLRQMLKERSGAPAEQLVSDLALRTPGLQVLDVAVLLLEVAAAAGPSEARVRQAVEFVSLLGLPEDELRGLGQQLGLKLGPTSTQRAEALRALGLGPQAGPEEVKRAYRRQMREHHPDRHAREGDEAVRAATKRTVKIQQAYETLRSSPASLSGAAPSAPPAPSTSSEPKPKPKSKSKSKKPAPPFGRGSRGVTLEELRPMGMARFGKRQVPVCLAAGDYLPADTPIEVVDIEGELVLVTRRHEASPRAARRREQPKAPPAPTVTEELGEMVEGSRELGAFIGVIVGGVLGFGAGGIGAIPGAILGGLIGWFWPEIGGCALVALVALGMAVLALLCGLDLI